MRQPHREIALPKFVPKGKSDRTPKPVEGERPERESAFSKVRRELDELREKMPEIEEGSPRSGHYRHMKREFLTSVPTSLPDGDWVIVNDGTTVTLCIGANGGVSTLEFS